MNRNDAIAAGLQFYISDRLCTLGHSERKVSDGKCRECVRQRFERLRRSRGQAVFQPDTARAEAKVADETYYIGKPCKYGHNGKRSVLNGVCVHCANEASRKNSKAKGYQFSKAWAQRNKPTIASIKYKYRRTDKGLLASRKDGHARRSRGLLAEGTFSASDITRIFSLQKGKCGWCRCSIKNSYHIDHIQSLSKGGSNWPRNLQLLCAPCNLSKFTKDPIEFAQANGRLI